MYQVVATEDLAADQTIARYPVQLIVNRTDDHPYAITVYYEGRRGQRAFKNLEGQPSRAAFQHYEKDALPPIGMLLNEPTMEQVPNCRLIFLVVKKRHEKELEGTFAQAFVETIAPVKQGDALTWCYGCTYEELRDYDTPCSCTRSGRKLAA